ncbi:MAG TPA: class I SAM-dependent methyltransferase [Pseudolabrys sp.]|nr:class I SAM-dependent methyltransferase [Pseudolabrys sp.]
MSAKAAELMQAIHGENIYAGYGSVLPLDLKGWHSTHETFIDLIVKNRPSVVFDVGVWKGGSTIFMANLLKENGITGAIVAIDTFLGSPEHWDRTTPDGNLIMRRAGRPLLYEQFLTNVLRVGMHDLIVPFPQTSDNAAIILSRLGIRADLIHIDAAHEYDAVMRDIRAYWELLEPGGYLLGDDYAERWPDVVRAANEFAESINQKPTVVEPKWYLRKP